jgi:hemoglobin/transferrin/lactoferrin receptor protein
MTMPYRRLARSGRMLSTVAALALLASPAAAQDGEGLFQMLGRIILGTGTAKVAIDTPQSVSTVEAAELDRDQPQTLSELFKATPGVQGTGASARPLGQAFNIRGIGNTEQTASEARIIVTVDGAPKFFEQYRLGSFFGDFELFKRVEVLRGPASSTLYGAGAIGGVVNFTTKDAADFLAEGETTALRFKGGYDTNGDGKRLGVIWAQRTGNAEFLGSLNRSDSNDRTDGSGNILPGSAHLAYSGLVKGKWTFGEDADQSLTLSLSRTDSDLDDTAVAQTGGAAGAFFGTADIHTIDDTASLTWNHGFADNPLLDLTVQLSYTDTSVDKRNFSLAASCAPGRNSVLCDSDFGYATTSLKIENTADLSAGNWDNYLTAGIQLTHQDRTANSSVGDLLFHPEGTDRKIGLYAQGEFTWNDRLTLIPGLRIDFGKVTPGAGAVAAGGTEQSDTAVSPKLAVMYKVSDEFSVFGSLARTERLPTLDELYSAEDATTLPARLPSLNLEKEEADNIEIGATWQREGLFTEGDSFQVKATLFHNDLTNMIAVTPRVAGGDPVPYFSNIAAAKLWGAEIEAAYDAERWFAQLAYSQVRSKDRSTGLTLADTPAENVVLTVGAKLPDQGLTIGWRASYFDDIVTSSATTSAPHYDTHDLFVTWSPQDGLLAGLDVNLSVENVFDATYRNNLSLDNAIGRNAKLSISKNISF